MAVLLTRIRRLLLAVLVVGMAGTLTELALLSHYEDAFQMAPLGVIVLSLAIAVWHVLQPGPTTIRALRGAMILFLIAGAAGVAFHFNGAAEFQLEIDPSQGWRDLVAKVVRAHAPPLLAPGVMVQLGLIGLIYTYGHPAVARADRHNNESEAPA